MFAAWVTPVGRRELIVPASWAETTLFVQIAGRKGTPFVLDRPIYAGPRLYHIFQLLTTHVRDSGP